MHSLEEAPTLRTPRAEVAVVDGVCLFLARDVLDAAGGFDEGYGFFHGYDRDLSFAVRELGLRCAVVNAPVRAPGRGHADGRERTGGAARGSGPAAGGAGALRREVGASAAL